MSTGQWGFINVSHPDQLSHAANISTIRRTAMLAVHRIGRGKRINRKVPRERIAAHTNHPRVRDRGIILQPSIVGWEKDLAKPLEVIEDSREESTSCYEETSSDSISSFAISDLSPNIGAYLPYMVINNQPYQEYLLDHWVSVLARDVVPVSTNHNPMGSVWVRYALEDPLLMSAILFHTSVHLDVIYQRPPSKLTLYHGTRTTTLMKMRLNSGHQPPKDTSIAAVTTILANQITSNDHVEMQLHLDALVKMVQIRGGLRMLGMDGVLEKSIKLLDIQTAMFQNARPRFLASTTSESSSNAFAIMSLIDLEGFPYMDTSAVLFYLRKEIASLTKMYSRLMIDPSRTTTVQAMKFLSRRTDIEYILLLAAQGFAVMQGPDQDARLREACCLAGSIYVNYVLRGFKPSSALILKTLKKRLMTCVERFELETRGRTKDVPTSIAVLFWALNVGGTMSLDVTEKSWFMLRLSRTAKHFGVRDWKSASLLLGDYPWAVKLQNEAWESIWVDLEQSLVYD